MKYMGSKARYAKQLLLAIKENCRVSDYDNWVEPFVGGANMIAEVDGINRIGNDINLYLIRMFRAVQTGWQPSDSYTEGEYLAAKMDSKSKVSFSLDESAEIGFIGIGCSYSGKWFGGYARGNTNKGTPRNYAKESKDNLLKQKPLVQTVTFLDGSYRDLRVPPRSIIYCDPPYSDTTSYSSPFKSGEFWAWCDELVQLGHPVFVSEYKAPEGWRCVWEREVNSSLTKETGSKKAVERLFVKQHSL